MAAAVTFAVTLVEMDDGRLAVIMELGDQALAVIDPGAAPLRCTTQMRP
jgi:hypothetical protein